MVLKSPADKSTSFYVRASRYRGLLHFVAYRVLGDPDRADIAVKNCLFAASHRVTAFDCEGAFRSWLVRIAVDQALAILHGRTIREHRRDLMTAAMLCSVAGIEQKTLENSAAYLKTWIVRLKSDSRLLVSAASQAQKAADFIQGKAVYREMEAQAA
jgi:DNA-directed RNA polymerase specialized sigma24 family protein